jgi:hypothetical protein
MLGGPEHPFAEKSNLLLRDPSAPVNALLVLFAVALKTSMRLRDATH